MSRWLRQSTAATAVTGPMLDKTDGVTEKTAQNATVKVSKNTATFVTRSGSASASAHDTNGYYRIPLDATDTGTAGPFVLMVSDSTTQLPAFDYYMVVPANVYDSLIGGTDTLSASVGKWLGTAPNSLISGRVDANSQVIGAAAIVIGSFAASALSAGAFSSSTIAADIIGANAFTIGKFGASALSAANFSNNTIASSLIAASAFTAGKFALDAIDDNALASAAATKIWQKTMTEPTAPASVTDTAINGLAFINSSILNKSTQTSATYTLRNNADSATIASASVTDSAGTFTRAKLA